MERKPFPSETQERFIVRFPDGMRDRIAEAAKANNRSMNSEVVARLERSFAADREVEEIAFESAFEATGLKQEIERLSALLKANESKTPSTDEIAEKVAAQLLKMIPISLEDLERFTRDYAKPPKKPSDH